jgi:hypothetical protein
MALFGIITGVFAAPPSGVSVAYEIRDDATTPNKTVFKGSVRVEVDERAANQQARLQQITSAANTLIAAKLARLCLAQTERSAYSTALKGRRVN